MRLLCLPPPALGLRKAADCIGVALLLATLLAAIPSCFAQTYTATIRGSVRYADAAAPLVALTLVQESTNAERKTESNPSGEFTFAAVAPGTYTLRAAAANFRAYEQRGIALGALQTLSIDIVLELEAVATSIDVQASFAPLVETTNASTGGVFDGVQINTLPSPNRLASGFAVTLPTVVSSGNPELARLQDLNHPSLISLGGGARRANNYVIDGVPHTDLVNRPSVNPTLDLVESMNIQLHTYDAETGRTGGGTFNVASKSGSNQFHGLGFFQHRPHAWNANNFFAARAGQPLPPTYWRNGGGALGGPIRSDRTFFYYNVEGYRNLSTRNAKLHVPSRAERQGDFSRTLNAAGQLVQIYDPLTAVAARTPFVGNLIPQSRLNPVALAMMKFYPLATRDVSDGEPNFDSTAQQTGHALVHNFKLDHQVSSRGRLSGLYITNRTQRTNDNYWEPGQGPNRFADPRDGTLDRSLHLVALNHTWSRSNSVLALRWGYTRLQDDDATTIGFDPSTLGFAPTFLQAMQIRKFPTGTITDYEGFGAVDPTRRTWSSWSTNGNWSQLVGVHSLKFGVDFRRIWVDTQSFQGGAGDFRFDRFFTSADPLSNGTATSGNAMASFLLGYPSGDPNNQSRINVSAPLNAYVKYYGLYAQADSRLRPRFTLNYGLRLEREDGLRERENRFTVGFDAARNPGGALGAMVINGRPVRGGLIYAGQNGAALHQGNPPALKVSPRIGFAWTLSPTTVLRGGFGVYWAPWNFQPATATNYGQVGFSRQTFIDQGQFVPTALLNNPFPGGALQPQGSALGALAGVGGQIEFVDQTKGAPWVSQYSVDLTRQWGQSLAWGVSYMGATGRSLGLGGSGEGVLNINQLDPANLALGNSLLESVPNPFFGLPQGQGFAVSSPTVQRRQLLRPYPQFGDVRMLQSTLGRSQYHALVVKLDKRMSRNWSVNASYTWSRLMDNQFGETNFQQGGPVSALNAYNLGPEYSVGLLDVPHRLVATPVFHLPFGAGQRWARQGWTARAFSRITASAILTLESGFPVPITSLTNNTGLFTLTQRPVATGANPYTTGSRSERILNGWLNPAAFRQPAAFTLGTAPRIDPNIRGPHRNNLDLAVSKQIQIRETLRAELRAEVLNATNTVKVVGPNPQVGSSLFGKIQTQSGWMRLAQYTLRFQF